MINSQVHSVNNLYTGVRGLAIKVLSRVERTDAYLDRLLDYELRTNDLNPPDKALLYEIVHGVTRWMGRLDWILSGFYKGQFSKALPILKNSLRVALYQIMFLDKIPEYAAVNEAVDFIKKLQGQKPADISNAVLRNILRSKANLRYPDPQENLIGYIATYYSHPAWMVKRWLARYGKEATEQLLIANNERPYNTLRVNLMKTTVEEFSQLLNSVGLKHHHGKFLPDFFHLHSMINLNSWQYFLEGYCTIQDESQGLACRLLDPKPGDRVLDLCAAPGGKTAYLGQLMQNEGEIVAVDVFEARSKLLKQTMKRVNLTNVTTVVQDASQFEDEPFDCVLADVPCSGFGTLSKKPDIKWRKELLDIQQITLLQMKILERAASLVKPGGKLVYSTCTIEPEENEDIIFRFLSKYPDFKIIRADETLPGDVVDEHGFVRTLPHIHKIDGAFASKLVRIK
ncbi:MAG: 16S rRNA (cytosine(967)-C(5))-methyltransferase RsmB [Ignavibacteria bacterium]|nr:16S rRNA (cytosine(967)-C(5))-methyltransferase RsmB [Ignavibacteria bacterium]